MFFCLRLTIFYYIICSSVATGNFLSMKGVTND